MSARRDARAAVAPAGGPAFPSELLDANDVAWIDASDTLAVRAETGEGEFAIRFARRRRHRLALEEFAREHDLMSDKYPWSVDHSKLRALAEAHGQHWPPRRIALGWPIS